MDKYRFLRKTEYMRQGVTVEEMVIALWEKMVENRAEKADELQAKRLEIKAKFPKV